VARSTSLDDAKDFGFKPEKVAEIAAAMGLDVEAVVKNMARDYFEHMLRSFE
jgi:hypothetical protein